MRGPFPVYVVEKRTDRADREYCVWRYTSETIREHVARSTWENAVDIARTLNKPSPAERG